MNFQELMDAVALETGYGHLTDLVEGLCKAALLKLHNSEQFPQDLVQTTQSLAHSDLKFSVTLPTGYRSFESVKVTYADSSTLELPYRSLSWIKDNPYETDYFTVVGSNVSFNLCTPATSIQFTYYSNPIVTAPFNAWTNWILTQHAQAVKTEACALVFEAVELFDRAQVTRNSGGVFMQSLRNVGYQPQAFEAIGEV